MPPALGIALLYALLTPSLTQPKDAVLRLSKGVLSDGESLCLLVVGPWETGTNGGPWGLMHLYQHSPISRGREGNGTRKGKSRRLACKPPPPN